MHLDSASNKKVDGGSVCTRLAMHDIEEDGKQSQRSSGDDAPRSRLPPPPPPPRQELLLFFLCRLRLWLALAPQPNPTNSTSDPSNSSCTTSHSQPGSSNCPYSERQTCDRLCSKLRLTGADRAARNSKHSRPGTHAAAVYIPSNKDLVSRVLRLSLTARQTCEPTFSTRIEISSRTRGPCHASIKTTPSPIATPSTPIPTPTALSAGFPLWSRAIVPTMPSASPEKHSGGRDRVNGPHHVKGRASESSLSSQLSKSGARSARSGQDVSGSGYVWHTGSGVAQHITGQGC